ncbi:hypothetical protein BKA81DRAFT_1301 [Phyllosticta paracitricarpa]|uniref:Uncharacterized protein n=2 Tax=Phyllosticta TaxID=121621 RepID=A0ABR1MKG6_9PEZI
MDGLSNATTAFSSPRFLSLSLSLPHPQPPTIILQRHDGRSRRRHNRADVSPRRTQQRHRSARVVRRLGRSHRRRRRAAAAGRHGRTASRSTRTVAAAASDQGAVCGRGRQQRVARRRHGQRQDSRPDADGRRRVGARVGRRQQRVRRRGQPAQRQRRRRCRLARCERHRLGSEKC